MHTNKIACGIHIIVHGNPKVNEIISNYSDVINYSTEMSLLDKGSIFVYLRSTYEESSNDQGEYIHSEDTTRKQPILSDREQEAINMLITFCYCMSNKLIWIHYSDNI